MTLNKMKLNSFLKAKVGTNKELENSLLRLRGKDADISLEASEIQVSFTVYTIVSNINYFFMCIHSLTKKN